LLSLSLCLSLSLFSLYISSLSISFLQSNATEHINSSKHLLCYYSDVFFSNNQSLRHQ
jgi:hypothetical protein